VAAKTRQNLPETRRKASSTQVAVLSNRFEEVAHDSISSVVQQEDSMDAKNVFVRAAKKL
jgi:hypothetical protein